MKDVTQNRRGKNFQICIRSLLRTQPPPGRDISQYQYFINKWVILRRLALEHCWRRSINPRMPQSSCICQSQPDLMTLPISQSGPSTHSLLPKWPDLIKSTKTFVQWHTAAHREQPYRLALRCLAAFLSRCSICLTVHIFLKVDHFPPQLTLILINIHIIFHRGPLDRL